MIKEKKKKNARTYIQFLHKYNIIEEKYKDIFSIYLDKLEHDKLNRIGVGVRI